MRLLRLLALAAVFPATTAQANPWDLYGFNARAQAMGGAHTAVTDDFTAVYYNPAALSASSEGGFGFGYSYAKPQLSLDFQRPESRRRLVEAQAPDSDGITFGASFSLGGERLAGRLAGGIALNVPTTSLLSGQALDPATPQWSMYQSLPRRLVAAISFGARPFDFLLVGGGMQIMAGVSGRLDYVLDPVVGQFTQKSVSFDIEPIAAPIFSLEVRPISGLRLAFAWRGSIEAQVDLPVDIELSDVAELDVLTFIRVQYSPHRLVWGGSYEVEELGLTVAVDLGWSLWSKAPDPSVKSAIDFSGDLFEETGFDQALDVPAPGRERVVDLGLSNVLELKLGVEQELGPVQIRAGYALLPTPSPVQTSGANYIDGTRHTVSLGAGVWFQDPLGALAGPLGIDVSGGFAWLPSRSHTKVTPDDPIGAYRASGRVWLLSFGLRYAFGEAVAPAPSETAPVAPAPPAAAPPAPPTAAPVPAPAPAPEVETPAPPPEAETETPLPEGDDVAHNDPRW